MDLLNELIYRFDAEKLLWINGQYLMRMTPGEIYPHLLPFLPEKRPAFDHERLAAALPPTGKPACRNAKRAR